MFCPRCGNKLPDDAVFCNRCGINVQDPYPASSGQSPPERITQQFNDAVLPSGANWSESPYANVPQLEPTVQALPPWQSSGTNWPQSQPVTASAPYPFSQQPGISQSQPAPAMPTAAPAQPLPLSAMQRLLVRIFQPDLASNALLGVMLGSILAIVLGALISDLILAIAHAITPQTLHLFGSSSEDSVDYALSIVPIHSPFRDSLQLFLVMHGAALRTQYVSGSDISTITSTGPLSGLLVVPALLLTLGGYIAASTDFQDKWQRSLLRGAMIAIPYTILLLIMVSQVNGCIPNGQGGANSIPVCTSTMSATLSIDVPSVILFGLIWGALFGLLGASVKLGRGQWRHTIIQYLRTGVRPQLVGMIAGGMAANVLGLALSLLALYGALAYTSLSLPLFERSLCYATNWQFLVLWGIAQGLFYAADLFLFSFGAPVTINNPQQASCFYVNSPHTTLSLIGGTLHLPAWTYALLALAIISLFLGGRVSASIGRVQGIGPGAIQGALIALPFTVLMVLLSMLSTVTYTTVQSTSSSSVPANTTVLSAGAGAFGLLLWALLSGAVFGALGGIYQTSPIRQEVSRFLSALAAPLRLLSKPGYFLLDRMSGQPRSIKRTHTRSLLYSAFLCAFLLALGAGVAGGVLIVSNQTLTFDINQRIKDIVSALVIVLPGLLLISACASALSEDPALSR